MQQQATLGGGCFWCLEAVYQQVKGVTAVESGYAGGHMLNPDYKSVCSGTTGHGVFQDSCRVDHSLSRHLNLSFWIQIDGANRFPVTGSA